MRAWIVVALLACQACQHADAPPPAAPKGPTACARASDSMVLAMLARLPDGARKPTEEADALRNLIRERCERDGWSADATRCLIAMKRLEDAEPCARLLTDEQQAALVRDQEAQLGKAAAESSKPAEPAANAPAGSAAPAPN
jgi:hypothetical protein